MSTTPSRRTPRRPLLSVLVAVGPVPAGLEQALRARGYALLRAETTAAAARVLAAGRASVALCADPLPDGRATDVVTLLRAADPRATVLLHAERPDPRDVRRALLAGAADYLVGPLTPAETATAVDDAARRHERATAARAASLTLASTGFAETLINAMEAKNAYLRGHSQRVADLAAATAEALGLAADAVEQVRLAGRLHDIGKIGIREAVLDKPGPLDADEYAHVKEHVRIGLEILAPMTDLGDVLAFISDHHERPDGSGYPRGLAGGAISLGGRILAAADTFDALTSRRAYRDSRGEQDTLRYMSDLVGASLFADVFDALRRAVERRQSLVFLGDMRAPAHPDEWPRAGAPAPADVRALVASIAALPPAQRLALTLHYLEVLSDAEIAGLTGADAASVAQMRRDALRRIAKAG